MIDTGIYTDHNQFEGRASWGKNFADRQDVDGNGHGTHVAGTIGSNVRVLPPTPLFHQVSESVGQHRAFWALGLLSNSGV